MTKNQIKEEAAARGEFACYCGKERKFYFHKIPWEIKTNRVVDLTRGKEVDFKKAKSE